MKELLNQQYIKIQLTQKQYWENVKITDHNTAEKVSVLGVIKYRMWILKLIDIYLRIGKACIIFLNFLQYR